MRTIWNYGKRYVPIYIIAMAAMILSILLDALSPQITKRVIDQVIIGGQMESDLAGQSFNTLRNLFLIIRPQVSEAVCGRIYSTISRPWMWDILTVIIRGS